MPIDEIVTDPKFTFEHLIVGMSPPMKKIYELIRSVAPSDLSVLIRGESGTGKELVAKAIHKLSPRNQKPFIAIDCSSIPEALIESEIFGHEKGAFTGAIASSVGKFEMANQGTLFLDEIGNLALPAQAKLLRFLENHVIERVGGHKQILVNVRLIAATNADLKNLIARQLFREDLYHRLNEFAIQLPPLRERQDDIPVLVEFFSKGFAAEMQKEPPFIGEETLRLLLQYQWPGNVRELKNVIKRAVLLSEKNIEISHLPREIQVATEAGGTLSQLLSADIQSEAISLKEVTEKLIEEVEKKLIRQALDIARGHRGEAAKILKIDPKTLYNKIQKYFPQETEEPAPPLNKKTGT